MVIGHQDCDEYAKPTVHRRQSMSCIQVIVLPTLNVVCKVLFVLSLIYLKETNAQN